jgi:hypothetical protein
VTLILCTQPLRPLGRQPGPEPHARLQPIAIAPTYNLDGRRVSDELSTGAPSSTSGAAGAAASSKPGAATTANDRVLYSAATSGELRRHPHQQHDRHQHLFTSLSAGTSPAVLRRAFSGEVSPYGAEPGGGSSWLFPASSGRFNIGTGSSNAAASLRQDVQPNSGEEASQLFKVRTAC